MTVAMICKLVFPPTKNRKEGLILRKVESIRVEKSWELLTDTATITMPRNVKFFEKKKVRDVFRSGDPIQIWFGYDDEENMVLEFEGFITEVSADIPIELKCEDQMFLLKKNPVNYAMKSTKLKDLINAIVPGGTKTDVAEIEISKQRFPATTTAQVLEKLQEGNIYSYYKGDTLVVGKIYSDDEEAPVLFRFGQNVVDNNLQYKHKEDILILIKATSTLPKGRKITAEFGDKGGVQEILNYYNIQNKDALLVLCKEDYEKFKVDGYKGNLKVFGVPAVQHGMKAKVLSDLYPDRNGNYFIKRTVKTFNTGGIRQELNLDRSVV